MRYPIVSTVFLCMLFSCNFAMATEDGFVSLFNGRDLTGWSPKGGDAIFRVEDGNIVGTVNDAIRNTFLCTEKEYENFIFKAEFKYDIGFNSGIQFRSQAQPWADARWANEQRERVYGYQCEMAPQANTGLIWDEFRRRRWLNDRTPELVEKTISAFKQGEWNELVIQCIGPSIRTWLNGQPITDIFDTETARGFFGLQVHSHRGEGQIRWRNIRVKELPATPWQPFFKDRQFVGLEVKPPGKWAFQEDGTVHATATSGENRDGLILSREEFDNFAVRVSFKPVRGRSGLSFRSQEIDRPHWVRGLRCVIAGDHTAGALWDVGGGPNQGGRGWVFLPTEETNAANIKPTEWNELSVVAVGDRIVTILNGAHVVDMIDPVGLKSGKTALRLQGGADVEYWFRDYEIMPLTKEMVDLIVR